MKISTRGKYGLEALIDLALNSASGPVNLKSIARDCDLSESYILQIFQTLKKAGILISVRGAQGGYILSREMSQISVRQVLEALEGPLTPVSCIIDNCDGPCSMYDMCATRLLWEKVKKSMDSLADSITLEDLVKNVYAIDARENPDYSI